MMVFFPFFSFFLSCLYGEISYNDNDDKKKHPEGR